MPLVYVRQLGKTVRFPDDMPRDEIKRRIDAAISGGAADDGVDIGKSLGAGWSAGWQDAADSAADYLDLLGADTRADAIRGWINEKRKAQRFTPEGAVEKILAGIAAAPGGAVGFAPAIGTGAAVTAATANPIAGAAAGFGLHGAVRGGDGDLLSTEALKEGLISAAEGAAFGGVSKVAGLGRLGRGAADAVVGTGGMLARSAADGEPIDPRDVASQAAVMGLLGAVTGGKKAPAKDAGAATEAADVVSRRMTKEMALAEYAKDAGIPGVKPPRFPVNLDLYPPSSREWLIDKFRAGEIASPERMSVAQMRQKAIDEGRMDVARELVLTEGNLAGLEVLTMEEFRSAIPEAQALKRQIDEAVSRGDSAAAESLRVQYEDVAQNAMSLLALDQGFGTEVARTMVARNAFRHELPMSEQALRYLAKRKELDIDSFNRVMSAATDDEIRAITKTAWEPTLFDKAHEAWIMSMLSNPLTWGPQGVNTVSNLLKNTLLKYPVKAVQIAVEKARAQGAGRAPEYTLKSLVDDFLIDVRDSGPVIRQFVHNVLHDKPMESSKLELTHGVAIGGQPGASAAEKALGWVTRFPGRFLEASDQAFRSKAQLAEAMRLATEKIGRGPGFDARRTLAQQMIDNPKEYKVEWRRIQQAGDDAVFTRSTRERSEYSALAKIGNVVQNLKQNKNPLVSVPAKMLAPFTRTPVNIAIEALQHSPFGAREYSRLKTLLAKQKMLRDSGDRSPGVQVMERDISEQIAKSVVGTTMMTWAFGEALAGRATGGGPSDPDDYRKWIEAGNQPYSFKVGDTWVSYQRIEPFASIFGMAADVAETAQAPSDQALDRAFAAVKDNLANKTFLLGVENLSKAWANPKRYGTTFVKSFASSMIPAGSLLGAAARATDPVQRMTAGDSAGESILNAAKNRIPGARQTLEPRYSVTGKPIVDEYNTFNALLPFSLAPATADPVDVELNRLASMGYKVPNPQDRKRHIPGEQSKQRATRAEYAIFHRSNRAAADAVRGIITDPSWANLDPQTQSNIIMSIYKKYGAVASATVRGEMYRRIRSGG